MGYSTRSQRVRMDTIQTLTFYNGEETAFRRTSPVPQMTCRGKPCMVFQPDAIQCTAQGGLGTDVEWKCQADLPSSMRFGRVEVSCEGYDHSDDPYILKGSCGLTYNLVPANPKLEDLSDTGMPSRNRASEFVSKFVGNLFNIVTLCILFYILYGMIVRPLLRYFTNNAPLVPGSGSNPPRPPPRPWFGGFGGFGGGGSGPGGGGSGGRGGAPPSRYDDDDRKPPSSTAAGGAQAGTTGWQPGFWTGLAGGALGATLTNSMRNRGQTQARGGPFGGGADRYGYGYRPAPQMYPTRGAAAPRDWDRGEGPSGATGTGSMRSSSGFGGTRNR